MTAKRIAATLAALVAAALVGAVLFLFLAYDPDGMLRGVNVLTLWGRAVATGVHDPVSQLERLPVWLIILPLARLLAVRGFKLRFGVATHALAGAITGFAVPLLLFMLSALFVAGPGMAGEVVAAKVQTPSWWMIQAALAIIGGVCAMLFDLLLRVLRGDGKTG